VEIDEWKLEREGIVIRNIAIINQDAKRAAST